LSGDTGVRIPNLSVNTGGSILANVYFSEYAYVQQALYIDSLFIDSSSFLQFDIGWNLSSAGVYIFTRDDYSHIINRIGFFDPKTGARYKAISKYWGDDTYCISMNEYESWQPPMVPEPSTYGAGLMGMGLAVACCRSRLRRGSLGTNRD